MWIFVLQNSQSQPSIANYMQPQQSESKENCDSNSNNNEKPTDGNAQAEGKSGNFDNLLDDDDDDYAMLQLDYWLT